MPSFDLLEGESSVSREAGTWGDDDPGGFVEVPRESPVEGRELAPP